MIDSIQSLFNFRFNFFLSVKTFLIFISIFLCMYVMLYIVITYTLAPTAATQYTHIYAHTPRTTMPLFSNFNSSHFFMHKKENRGPKKRKIKINDKHDVQINVFKRTKQEGEFISKRVLYQTDTCCSCFLLVFC